MRGDRPVRRARPILGNPPGHGSIIPVLDDQMLSRLAIVVADELYRLHTEEGVRPRDFVKHLEALAAKNMRSGI